MSKRQVYRWCSLFQGGRTSLEDEVRSGRPSIQETNASQVDLLIQSDRRLKVREIAEKLDLSKDTVYRIAHDMLGYRKVSARWVPKMQATRTFETGCHTSTGQCDTAYSKQDQRLVCLLRLGEFASSTT